MIDDVVVRPAGQKGQGVFALRSFEPGEFIFRRRHARVVSESHLHLLTETELRHLCELEFERYAILLPPGCYLNHSCEPSAMRRGVKVVAWRRIGADDEITVDYRLNAFGEDRGPCACGSPMCAGEVTWSFFALDEQTQQRYLPFAPPFIRRELRRRRLAGRSDPGPGD